MREELVEAAARAMTGRAVTVVQRGPLTFVDARGPLRAPDADDLARAALDAVEAAVRADERRRTIADVVAVAVAGVILDGPGNAYGWWLSPEERPALLRELHDAIGAAVTAALEEARR